MGKYSQMVSNTGGGKYSKMLYSTLPSAKEDTTVDPNLLERNKRQVEQQVSSQRKIAIPDTIYKGIQELASIYSAPSDYIGKGLEQLGDNPIAGAINIGQGVAHGAFSLTGFPQLLTTISTANKTIFGEKAGKAFDDVMNLPAISVQEGTKQLNKVFGDTKTQIGIFRGTIANLIATGRPEMKVLTPLLDLDERRLNEISEGLNEVNQLGATLLAFKGLDKIKPEKVTHIKVTEELRGKEATDMLDKQTQLQSLYNERNARLKSVDELKGSNQQFMKSYVSKLEERIKPLEDELGIRATVIENNIPVEGLTQETPVNKLMEQRVNETLLTEPLSYQKQGLGAVKETLSDNQAFIEGRNTKLIPDAEKATSNLPSLEEVKIVADNSNLGQAIKSGKVTTEIKPNNSPISSTELQGKEIVPKPIESIGSSITEQPKPSNSSVFGEEIPTETKLNTTDIIKEASTELNDKPINIAQKSIKIDDKVYSAPEAINHKQSWDKAVEQLGAGEVSKAFAEGRISVLDEQGNWKSLNKKEEIKPVEEVKPTDAAPEETTFGATLLPADFSLKNMKSNFTENTETIKNVLSQGARLVYEGTRDFKDWSAQMSKLYGDAIQPHLQRVWLQTQGLAKDDRNQFGQDLLKYASEKNIIPSKFTRAGRELMVENATANIREMINKKASQEDFNKAVKQTMFDSPEQQNRFEELHNKKIQESKTGRKILNTDELIEYKNLKKQSQGGLKSSVINNVRIPFQVVEEVPTLKAIYQTYFEAGRTAEIEKIKLTNNFTTLAEESRRSTGSRYDDNIIKALSGEKVTLTSAEEKFVGVLKDFINEAKQFKEKIKSNYDLPHKPRGLVEAYRKSGLLDALKEKMKKADPEEVNNMVNNFGSDKMFDPNSLTRFGRTENPTMDILQRLEGYIDIFTLQKHLEPVVPIVRRLETAMYNAGLINNTTWSKNYLKELFGEDFNTGMQGNKQFKTAMNILNNVASIRYLSYNPTGGLGNLIGGVLQNVTSKDITAKELAIGTKRLGTGQGFDILTERGIVDVPLLDKTLTAKDMKRSGTDLAKAVASPYQFYSAGEQIIQGQFYLGKLTPEEFRTKIISASRDRQILEGKAAAQGGYHRGMRPSIVRTTLGKSAMKFRLWVPAVLESKVQKIISAGRLVESVWKGKNNITMKDKANLKASLKEITTLGSAVLILNELPDDTKKFLSDALSNAYGFMKGEYWARQTQNLIPAAQTVTELSIALSEAGSGSVYEQDSDYGKKGESKAIGTLKRLAPTVIKPLVKEEIDEDIIEIRELQKEVNDLKKLVMDGDVSLRGELKVAEIQLEIAKKKSPSYIIKQIQNQREQSIRNKYLGK